MARPTPQEIQDLRDAPKQEEAYRKSLTSTPEAPAPKASAPVVKKAKGGRIDGIARKGKTHCKVC